MSSAKDVLRRAADQLGASGSIQDVYDTVVATCRAEVGAEASALLLEDEDGERLRVAAAHGYACNLLNSDLTYERGEGITGTAWATGQTVRCDSHDAVVNHPNRKG